MGKGLGCLGAGVLAVIGLGVLGAVLGGGADPAPGADPAAPPAEPYRDAPGSALRLVKVRGEKGGFDSVLILSGTIENAAAFPIKDPVIACDLFGPSGTQVGQVAQTLYEVAPAQGTLRFKALNMGFLRSGQVARFSCAVSRAQAAD